MFIYSKDENKIVLKYNYLSKSTIREKNRLKLKTGSCNHIGELELVWKYIDDHFKELKNSNRVNIYSFFVSLLVSE